MKYNTNTHMKIIRKSINEIHMKLTNEILMNNPDIFIHGLQFRFYWDNYMKNRLYMKKSWSITSVCNENHINEFNL